jgi:hypothetical protein
MLKQRELFSWWKRWPLWFVHCSGEIGHWFTNTHDEHKEEPKVRWVLAWCTQCGHGREVDIRC